MLLRCVSAKNGITICIEEVPTLFVENSVESVKNSGIYPLRTILKVEIPVESVKRYNKMLKCPLENATIQVHPSPTGKRLPYNKKLWSKVMKWIDKLERRYGRYGIPNLMNGILIGQAVVWVLVMFVNYRLYDLITLSRAGLMRLQLWRLVSFVFVPSMQTNLLFFALTLYFYWWMGNSLERAWGDFRFTVYWLVGIVGAWLSCLISGYGSASGILLSMFFAYAWMWPEQQLLLFYILPVKVKWLGWAAAAVWALNFMMGSFSGKLCMLFGLASFLLFFGGELWRWCRSLVRDYKRRRDWKNNFR